MAAGGFNIRQGSMCVSTAAPPVAPVVNIFTGLDGSELVTITTLDVNGLAALSSSAEVAITIRDFGGHGRSGGSGGGGGPRGLEDVTVTSLRPTEAAFSAKGVRAVSQNGTDVSFIVTLGRGAAVVRVAAVAVGAAAARGSG
jgi:hypothetical protein